MSSAPSSDNSKVSFVNGAALCGEGDLLENIEKLVCSFGENDYVVLDGLDIVCSLLPDTERKYTELKAFIDRLIDTERYRTRSMFFCHTEFYQKVLHAAAELSY